MQPCPASAAPPSGQVCRHHAAAVACGSGTADHFTCPYHGWTYDTRGRLRKAPRVKGIKCFKAADWGLKQVPLATWGPFVFLWLGANQAAGAGGAGADSGGGGSGGRGRSSSNGTSSTSSGGGSSGSSSSSTHAEKLPRVEDWLGEGGLAPALRDVQ